MNKELLNAFKGKFIYVDIDGTLAEYRFNNHVSAKDGTTNGQTMEEIVNHIFLTSRPLKTVIKTLKRAKVKGLWICGAVISPIEVMDKLEWLKKNCKGLKIDNYDWFVPDEYWGEFIEYFKDELGVLEFTLKDDVICNKYGTFFKGSKTRIWNWLVERNIHKLEDTVFIDDVLSLSLIHI